MKKFFASALLLLVALTAGAQTATINGQRANFRVVVGSGVPSSGGCDAASERGSIYMRTGNQASVPTQFYACRQTGSSTYEWGPIGWYSQASAPATCAVSEIWFDTDATPGSNLSLCTSSNTWTAISGGGSVFTGSTASTSAFSATPTFSLADVSTKSPTRFEPGALTANVTSVTFTNKTAGAKFSIAWLQDGTGGRTVTYGASASNTCTISATASKTTTQFFEVKADGTTVVGVGCSTDDPADTPPYISGTPTTGNCAQWASATAVGDSGSPCGGGGTLSYTTPYLVNSGSYHYPGMYAAATLPSAATWSSTGGTNTWTAAGNAYTLSTAAPGGNGANVSGRRDTTTLSSGDFTVTTYLVGCSNPAAEVTLYSGCGMFLYDGTKFVAWGMSANSSGKPVLAYDYYTNATTIASQNQINGNFYYYSLGLIGLRITKSSGNLAFAHTTNGGLSWVTDASGVSCTAHFASCASLNAGVHASPTWTGASASTAVVSWLVQ